MDKISDQDRSDSEFFLTALDEAEDAEMEIEFLALFFKNHARTRSVYTSARDALGDLGIA